MKKRIMQYVRRLCCWKNEGEEGGYFITVNIIQRCKFFKLGFCILMIIFIEVDL